MRKLRHGCLAAWALLAAACSPGREPVPSVVLITLDTFRADHLGCAGDPVVRTPHLDRLARRGTQWSEAVTAIPLTTPSHATILSGMSPRAHGLLRNRMRLKPSIETVAELMGKAGFATAGVVSSPLVLGPELGLNQGFDDYLLVEPRHRASGDGAETTRTALEWFASDRAHDAFLWVHYFDAHLPYLPPPPLDKLYDPDYDGAFARLDDRKVIQALFAASDSVNARDVQHLVALYASEVTFLDRCVGTLVREIEAGSGGSSVRFVVTADHGETLYEHERYFGHDMQLYDTSLRVPLVISGGGVARGRVVREQARTRDIAPTVLGLVGLLAGREMVGRDLLNEPPPRGDAADFIAETHPARKKAPPLYALRTETRKVVWQPRRRRWEHYDLAKDPRELSNLVDTNDPTLRIMGEDLELDLRHRPVGDTQTIDDERGGPDEETQNALRSLGYID